MIEVKVFAPIASQDDALLFSALGIDNAVFSAETVNKLFADNPDETDFNRCF